MHKRLFLFLVGFSSFCINAHAEIATYKLELVPNLEHKSIVGKAEIIFSDSSIFNFKADTLVIDNITLNNKTLPFKVENSQISIDLKKQKSKLIINYHATSSNGLVFGKNYLYSNFSTCSWMPCAETPDEQFPFELQIVLPKNFKMVGNGKQVAIKNAGKEQRRHIWKQSSRYSSYLLGFATGIFEEFDENISGHHLKYLGSNDNPEDLKKKFQETANIVSFFEEKSGVSLPNSFYTQVLVPDYEAQEKSTFSIIGKPFLDPILTDPKEDWVIVHELAHQWWGNTMTCKSWEHFWLNEGLTVFMTAAYKQKKWGEESYQKEIELAKKHYQKAIEAKMDVPLTFSGAYPSLQIKRAVVYSKGILFLDALRTMLGDEIFWKALREYTMSFNGKLVESKDFQNSFEKSSGKNLSEIFNKWVY